MEDESKVDEKRERTHLADSYSARARAARTAQGLPETVTDATVLAKVATWLDDDQGAVA